MHRATDVHQSIWLLRRLDGNGPWRLTSNEFALASRVARGCAVKQAAAELDLEWATARTTIRRALRKLGLRSCAHLPAFWHGLSRAASASRVDDGTELLSFESSMQWARFVQARCLGWSKRNRSASPTWTFAG